MKAFFVIIFFIFSSEFLVSQNYPFPQNAVYPFGIMPLNRNHVDADTSYQNWKARHVTTLGAGGYRRVLWDTLKATVSEGIGYGMLISVNMNDKTLFDDLWGYYNLHLNENGLMRWLRDSTGGNVVIGGIPIIAGSATDAEEDVAYALVLADRQWGSAGSVNYIQEAEELIDKIFQYEIDSTLRLPKSGDEPGSIYRVNISYFAPAYYRVFREVTGNTAWDTVITNCYQFLFFRANTNTGLVPDWCLPNGDPLPPCPPPYSCRFTYYYDATRTPWRIGMDYIWHGNLQALLYCNRITSFARSVGAPNIADEYNLTGDSLGIFHNNAFVGPFAAGAMGTTILNQLFLDSIYSENVNTYNERWNYYNSSLKTLTLLTLTGNFISGQIALPVEMQSFISAVNGNSVHLQWITASEINNKGFEVQRKSLNGEWNIIGFVEGSGNTNFSLQYSFIDKITNAGKYFYRLKQMDFNGNYEFHFLENAVVINAPDETELLQNFPNPFNPETKIRFNLNSKGKVELNVYDINGRMVDIIVNEILETGYYQYTFQNEVLPSGTYFYTMKLEGKMIGTGRMIYLK